MQNSLKSKAIKGTIWSACDRFGVMALQFFVNLVLARLLTPDDFGAIGLLYIFMAVSMTFIDGGFGSALIQKKNPSDTDYSTIFFWNLGIGFLIYLILYICSPLISVFYRMPILTDVLRVFGITLIFNGIVGVQTNRLQKQLKFQIIAITNIIAYVFGAAIAIFMAIKGFGVWSLVALSVSQPIFRSLTVLLITRWVPKLVFSYNSFKRLVSFGGFLLMGNLLESICKNLQGLIIGCKFSATQMGYYTQADKLDQIVSYSIPQIIASVMYPVFSQFQDDKERLNSIILLDLRVISFVIYPILTILILIAPQLIVFLYGTKWEPSVPYFQILCIGGFCYSLNNIPYYAVAACGKSKSLFFAGLYKWGMLGILMLIGMNFGMIGLLWAIAVNYINIFLINCILAKKYTSIEFKGIFKSIAPSFALSWFCGFIIYLLTCFVELNWLIAIACYIVLFIAITSALKIKAYYEVKDLAYKVVRLH